MNNKKKKLNDKNNNKISNYKKSISSNKYLVLLIAVVVTIIGIAVGYPYFISVDTNAEASSDRSNLLGDWHDIHGVGVFNTKHSTSDDGSIYLATHNGLYNKNQNSSWIKVGSDRSDLMGFVVNPNKEGVMYSSGHPVNGGNLGFRMSQDSGKDWETISSVTDTPIDFHAMSISPVNSNILYGSPGGGNFLYVTQDEGKTWSSIASIPSQIISIAADPSNQNGIYIGTTTGLFYSNDQGNNWKKVEAEFIGDSVVTGLGFNQDNELFAYAIPKVEEETNNQNGYIIKSDQSVSNWTKTNGQIPYVKAAWKFELGQNNEMYTIVSQQTPEKDVASSIYKSTDNGNSWILEGTNRANII